MAAADNMARQVERNEDIGVDDQQRAVPIVHFDYGSLDRAEQCIGRDSDREVLQAALALTLAPAPVRTAAARLAVVFGLLNPRARPVDILRHYHGLRRSDLVEAKLELAAQLSAPGQDEKKTAAASTETVSQNSVSTTYEVEAPGD